MFLKKKGSVRILLIHRKESHVLSRLPPNLTEFSTVCENKRRGESHHPFVQNIFIVELQTMKDLEELFTKKKKGPRRMVRYMSHGKWVKQERIIQKSFNLNYQRDISFSTFSNLNILGNIIMSSLTFFLS